MAKKQTVVKKSIAEKTADWIVLQEKLKSIKKQEMDLRVEICSELAADKPVGTHNFEKDGFKIKVKIGENINIDDDAYFNLRQDFTDEEKECVRLKPNLKISEYKKLTQAEGYVSGLLDECITVTPATPTLEVKIKDE